MDQDILVVAILVAILVGGVAVVIFLWHLVTQRRGERTSKEFIGENVFAHMRVSESSEGPRKLFQLESSSVELDKLITEIVIPSTEEQRNKWQFATLMLLTAKETKEYAFSYKPFQKGGRPKLYKSKTLSPKLDEFNNYIIARPEDIGGDTIHAEEMIFEKFDKLLDAYKTKNRNQTPASIMLYSWIMPCENCTEAIIKELLKQDIHVPVTIVYTIPWRKKGKQIQGKKSRKRFKEKGISVEHVRCPYRLQPKS